MYKVNRKGERTPPWRAPLTVKKVSERQPSHNVLSFCLWYMFNNNLMMDDGISRFVNASKNLSNQTLSKALEASNRAVCLTHSMTLAILFSDGTKILSDGNENGQFWYILTNVIISLFGIRMYPGWSLIPIVHLKNRNDENLMLSSGTLSCICFVWHVMACKCHTKATADDNIVHNYACYSCIYDIYIYIYKLGSGPRLLN